MRTMKLGRSELEVPVLAVGCMRISGLDSAKAAAFVRTAVDCGANFFDHADIYGGGTCETIFAQALSEAGIMRDQVILQSKCGIRKGMFDFSKEHIIHSVEGSLKRLNTEHLDVLLLHRPDTLMEPEEVAGAFEALEKSGKVRHFGVSNQNPMQMQLLQKYWKKPLVANQLQLSITNATMISQGFNVNMENDSAVNRDGSVLDFCRLNDITIQPWSTFQYGFFSGVFIGNEKFPELNAKLDEIAAAYGVSNTTIALAWILRHPAHMQPITGTMNADRLRECCAATAITLTRSEWYDIFRSAGNVLP